MCQIWLRSDGRVEKGGGYRHTQTDKGTLQRREGREGASGTVGPHLGVTSLNVELRNYVMSRQIVIERRVT